MTSREVLGSCAPQQRTKDTLIEGRKQEVLLKKHPFPWKVEFSGSNGNGAQRIKAFVTYSMYEPGADHLHSEDFPTCVLSLLHVVLYTTSCTTHIDIVLDFHTDVWVLEL